MSEMAGCRPELPDIHTPMTIVRTAIPSSQEPTDELVFATASAGESWQEKQQTVSVQSGIHGGRGGISGPFQERLGALYSTPWDIP